MPTNAIRLLRLKTLCYRLSSSYYNTCKAIRFSSNAVPKNMTLHHCSPIPTITTLEHTEQPQTIEMCSRPLVVLMGWMLANDKHLEKYRQMWFRRGCDVLTVRTSPIHLLLPPIGGNVVANNLANYLLENNSQYRQILIHAFSSGCYTFALLLSKLRSSVQYSAVGESIRGVICDSPVGNENPAKATSRVVTVNPVLQSLLERAIHVFWKVFLANNYCRVSHEFHNMYVRCPALVLYSLRDTVSDANAIRSLISEWSELGMCVHSKCWNASEHVRHYREHTREYEQQIDAFLQSINCNNSAAAVAKQNY